ncbi:glucose-6-phosphate dehydrogenase [Desulfovibrio ferrophilus]|uniref:Glucose-6-phosphate 1-dehydrogenase n=1 Tax=Desulfovibrio ferrophilus TaxID=241368 RepID=A0A2Z6B2D4_9BACT|nr:glucose-6-phosphate dehydrogenase [Desulfovibrio ferrophilus]BBD09641.1 glucose-6-phosphate 1-dehydrogenase [Desulfovibrio ferrophilus]
MDETTAHITAQAIRKTEEITAHCVLTQRPAPCALVIFGASGDLTARKLMPALYNLACNGGLPEAYTITGAARTDLSTDQFRTRMREAMSTQDNFDTALWDQIESRLFYQQLDYDESQGFGALKTMLDNQREEFSTRDNRIFYLATPPTVYEAIATRLGQVGLTHEKASSFARIVVEKPFGRDLPSARHLDITLDAHFAEHQIFRIDHYLAKETIQNILMFRFANSIFEPVWNRQYIEYVTCASSEQLGVEHRAGYYEQAGVLRDMFQNHMMQILALVAAEPPSLFAADRVRDEKSKVYRSLRPFAPERLRDDLILGQYGPGTMNGKAVLGYRQEPDVAPNSKTPTFAMMRVWVDNWRWQGVPFHIMSGKRLREKITRIVVQFREVPHSMFRDVLGQDIAGNRLVMDIHPENSISLTFQTKAPGAKPCLSPVTMSFDFATGSGEGLDAYEKVLLDCMLGDQMLFWRQDSVELCWGFLTPILELCEECGDVREHLHPYSAGSWGPPPALEMVNTLF